MNELDLIGRALVLFTSLLLMLVGVVIMFNEEFQAATCVMLVAIWLMQGVSGWTD